MSPSVDVKAKITHFLDDIGRVKTWPAKYTHKLYVISYLAQKIPAEREFTEQQINQLLSMRHTFGDSALLRRELFIQNYIDRNNDGTAYKRK